MLICVLVVAAGMVRGDANWTNSMYGLLEVATNWDSVTNIYDEEEPPNLIGTVPRLPGPGENVRFYVPGSDPVVVESNTGFTNLNLYIAREGETVFAIAPDAEYRITGSIYLTHESAWTPGNAFRLTNGTLAANGNVFCGVWNRGFDSAVVVTGPDTLLYGGSISMGYVGGGRNLMVVSNSATLWSGGTFDEGGSDGFGGNTVVVTGEGSALRTSGAHFLLSSHTNALIVEKGGLVHSVNMLRLGGNAWAQFNEGTGYGNTVIVRDGGKMGLGPLSGQIGETYVGEAGGENRLVVTGTDSVYYTGWLYVPANTRWSAGNTVEVYDGGYMSVIAAIYFGNNYLGNGLVVSGADSHFEQLWDSYPVYVGAGFGECFVEVTDGGKVTLPAPLCVGFNNFASAAVSNRVTVSGVGANGAGSLLWAKNIRLGDMDGDGNELLVSDGGQVATGNLFVGSGGAGNRVRVANGTIALTGEFEISGGNRVEIASTNEAVRVNGNVGIYGGSVLRYEFGKEWQSAGDPLVRVGGEFISDSTATLEIDARKFGCAGGGRIVLMEANADSFAALEDFAESIDWASGEAEGEISVEYADPLGPGRWQLVATLFNASGTMIMLR